MRSPASARKGRRAFAWTFGLAACVALPLGAYLNAELPTPGFVARRHHDLPFKSIAGWWKHGCADNYDFNVRETIDNVAFDIELQRDYTWSKPRKDYPSYFLHPKDPHSPILNVTLLPGRLKRIRWHEPVEDREAFAKGWTVVHVIYRQTPSCWLRSFWKHTVMGRFRPTKPAAMYNAWIDDPTNRLDPSIVPKP